jgi:hypothetical protein
VFRVGEGGYEAQVLPRSGRLGLGGRLVIRAAGEGGLSYEEKNEGPQSKPRLASVAVLESGAHGVTSREVGRITGVRLG